MKSLVNVAINGGAGQIAFSWIPLFCTGWVFGNNTKINLRWIEIPNAKSRLHGTVMEVHDSSYPLLKSIQMKMTPHEALKDADVCVFIATVPHKKGMDRVDLLKENIKIYKPWAEDINNFAHKDCKVCIVANPVNSLCSALAKFAPRISPRNFTSLNRWDYNRARSVIAQKVGCAVHKVKGLIIWGNHSDTQYTDTSHVTIDGIPIHKLVDEKWLRDDLVDIVANRWKKIVEMRGVTSIMSPANAIKDHIHDWYLGSGDDHVSMGVISNGPEECYGIPKGMCYSLPVYTKNFDYKVAKIQIDGFSQKKITTSMEEIQNELDSIGLSV